jgi:hypothetical protein
MQMYELHRMAVFGGTGWREAVLNGCSQHGILE